MCLSLSGPNPPEFTHRALARQLPDSQPSSLALGLERFGLIALRAPRFAAAIILIFAVIAAVGVGRIRVDDSLSQLFRSNTPEFRLYEDVTHRFPSSEFDVLVVVQGENLLEPGPLEQLRNLVTDLQLVDGTQGVISLFSAREAPHDGALPAPLFPDELPQGADYDRLIERVKSNDIIKGKLLSDDGHLALVVLSLRPDIVENNKVEGVVHDIRALMAEDLVSPGLHAELTGIPVMQLEIRKAVERDRIIYNSVGFAAGCVIAMLFFRRVSFMIIAAAPPLVAILLGLGALGWLDFRLNMFLNVMTPLIMVISFSDSMQLTFAARDRVLHGESARAAFQNAIYIVGPACVLTHATAGISFIALQFSNSDLIRTFGQAGLIVTAIALVAVLTLVPLLGVILLQRAGLSISDGERADFDVNILRRFCAWIAHRMVRRPGLYSLLCLLIVGGLAVNYATLQPRYRLDDQVPDNWQAIRASHQVDAALTGANPIDVLIEFPAGAGLYSSATLDTIAAVHDALDRQAGIGNVWSLETLRRWLAGNSGSNDVNRLKRYVDALPTYLVRRFIDQQQDAVVVSGRIPDSDASQLLPIIVSLDKRLDTVRADHPGYTIAITGLAVIAARSSAAMINKLNAGLTVEVIFVAGFIGLAFRSVVVALAALLPGVFPILLSGTLLTATGIGLQFTSVVALTVSFGLGLSATVHFLNRMRREEEPGSDPAVAVERATVLVGPALILTSLVLACGLAVTVVSDLPSLRLFGWLSAFAMLAALVADLLILRPTMTFLQRLVHGPYRLWQPSKNA
jgi:predicted RND superfamily exporter protein